MGFAQKSNVFIDYFTRPSSVPFLWAETLRSNVIEGIIATNRVELIDVDSQEALAVEKERRESGELSSGGDMERLKAMVGEGANYLIQGTVSSITTTRNKLESGSVYYAATCAYTLKLINPADGKLVVTKTYKHGDGLTNIVTGDTEDEAVAKLCKQAVKAMRNFVEEAFKIEGIILEVSSEKKGKADEVYISLGSDNGLAEGAYFDVCVERQVAGRTSQKIIGELKVKAVEGCDISLCEVTKGGEEILAALKGEQKLVIKSKEKLKAGDKFAKGLNKLF